MGLKLSQLDPKDVEVVGDSNSSLGRAPSSGLKLSDFHPDEIEHITPMTDPKTSPVTAMTTGMIQGAVPFAGAIAGAGKTAMDAITGTRGPLAGSDMSDLLDDYRNTRDSFSQDAKTAAGANRKTAFAGNLVGGVTNPLFTSAKTLPQVMGAGAVQGLGQSSADLTQGDVKGAAIDAGLGAAGGALGYGIGKAIPKAIDATKWATKKFLTTLGPSEEAINARLAGAAQPSAPSYPELAEDMGGSLKNLRGQISDKAKDAWGTLSDEPQISPAHINDAIDTTIDGLKVKNEGTLGQASKNAIKILNSVKSDINTLTAPKEAPAPSTAAGDVFDSPVDAFSAMANPKTPAAPAAASPSQELSQKNLKTIIQKLDENINWDDQSQSTQNTALESVRNKLDSILKFQNSAYKDAMEPVSQRMAVLNNIKRQFNFRQTPGEGLMPTDTTASKIQTALRDNKAVTQGNLDQLNDFTGKDYQGLAKDYQLSQQFDKTAPNGSRRTVLGGAIGALLGHGSPVAIGMGSGAGAVLDRYGGQAVGKMIDTYLKAGNSAAFGKFAPVIQSAANRGPQALAVTGSILSQNPEFRSLMGLDKE